MTTRNIDLWSEQFYEAIDPIVNSIGFFKNNKGWISPHSQRIQNDFDIWYITGGSGFVKVDNKWIGFKAGDLVTIKPGEDYQQEKNEDSSLNVYALHLSLFKSTDIELEQKLIHAFPRKITSVSETNIETLLEKLFEVHTFKKNCYIISQTAIVFSILEIIFENIRNTPGEKYSKEYNKISAAKNFIVQNYNNDLSLHEIARISNFSFTHFSKLFKQYFNTAPVNYHINCRLKMAKLFLAKGDSITEVSEKCGFHSIYYFSRLFKKRTGISPSDFSKACIIKR